MASIGNQHRVQFHLTSDFVVEFDGPNEDGDLCAEEEQLVSAYPQPANVADLPAWRQPCADSEQALDLSDAFHRILCSLCASMAHFVHASAVAEALAVMDMLLPLAMAGSKAGCAVHERAAEYLSGLNALLQACLADGHAKLSAAVATASAEELQVTPVLSPTALATLQAIARYACFRVIV